MAIIKCKMCGGDLDISEGLTVCECEYCGTKQTVPTVDDEKKITLFNRAGRLLRGCEFDKAAGVFESIVADFPEEAEAYWGLVLCKFGIEYVDDPATGKKVPTCHRSGFDSVMDDADDEQACENADAIARRQYREEAKAIEELRRGIIEVSGKEQPYDIFICYKETDENGGRTVDSVLAQDVYDVLTDKGYRVFFSRITLEDKLGQEYEPYIFAALNSAKIMLAFGTDFEYFNAVWVKNEWSRFLKLMEKDKSKHLIPCYKNIDAYDMPKEFARLQAQDMGKVGAVQDLLRGIEKLLPRKTEAVSADAVVHASQQALVERGNLALEDNDWKKAKELFDRVLDVDPKNAEAYLGLEMAEGKYGSREAFAAAYVQPDVQLDNSKNVIRVRQFGNSSLKAWLSELDKTLCANREQKRIVMEERAEEERTVQANLEATMAKARERIRPYQSLVAAGVFHTVGLKTDGTVEAVGDNSCGESNITDWENIVAVAAGGQHTIALRSDGTVLATGNTDRGCCDVSNWTDIASIATSVWHTVGLRSDGTVIATGENEYGECNVTGWFDMAEVEVGVSHTVGLRSNGTVVAVGHNDVGECDVSSWSNIVAIAAGSSHTIGLRSNGTVVAVGDNRYGQCDVSTWREIVAIAAGNGMTMGLKADGTVVAVGSNEDGQCDVTEWRDIVAITANPDWFRATGLKADGTVVAAGDNCRGQCNVSGWKLFRTEAEKEAEYEAACTAQKENTEEKLAEAAGLFESLADYKDSAERAKACQKAYTEIHNARVKTELVAEKSHLAAELPNIKGIFSGGKRKQIEARIEEIDAELAKL